MDVVKIMYIVGLTGALSLTCACASAASPSTISFNACKSSNRRAVGMKEGNVNWNFPRASISHSGAWSIRPGVGPDPMTGSGDEPICITGVNKRVSDESHCRVEYVAQSWDGTVMLHDSWRSAGIEQIPTSRLGEDIYARIEYLQAGSVMEFVNPARIGSGAYSTVVVVSLIST